MKKILPFVLILALLTGCGSSGSSTATYNTQDFAGGAAVDTVYSEEAVMNYAQEKPISESSNKYEDKLVYTCSLDIGTLNYDSTVKDIKEKIKFVGGFISSENEYDNEYGWYYADHVDSHNRTINIAARIPSEKYETFVNSLEGDGKIISKSSSVDNISRQYYDTEAVIESLIIQEERLLLMMDEAQTIDEMIAVEARLTEVQTQLNQYRTSLAVMDSDVAYSTVYINIDEVYEYTPDIHTNTFFERLKNSVSDAISSFGSILENLLFAVIWLIPRLVIYVPLFILIVIIVKKIRAIIKSRRIRSSLNDMVKDNLENENFD